MYRIGHGIGTQPLSDNRTSLGRRASYALRRLKECTGGTTAVEFALIAVPFLAIVIAILETGMIFLAQEELDTATTQTARLILTGQAQANGVSAAQFQQDVCANAVGIVSCSGLYVNVQTYSSFASMSLLNPLQSGAFNSASLNYNIGGPGDIELVQVFYLWPVIPGLLGFNLSNMNGNSRLIEATAVFRNEPYGGGVGG